MGVLHNELESTSLGRAIRAALGIREGAKTIERFGETLTPTIDLWSLPEWYKVRDELLWARSNQIAAGGAGLFGQAWVVNPATSGKLVVVEIVQTRDGSAAQTCGISVASEAQVVAQALAGTLQVVARDLRGTNTVAQKLGTTLIYEGTAAGLTGTQVWRQANPSTLTDTRYEDGFVLPPGTAVGSYAITANHIFEYAFSGRERKALAGELP